MLSMSFVPKAQADGWDKKTIVTINEPIIAGKKVLHPGTYVWKLLDSQSDRHVVQIFDKDQQHLEETILAIPDYKLEPTGKSEFSFWETPAGVPRAVHTWFYPGDNFGQDFVYPKKLVAQLAAALPVPVRRNYREPEPVPVPEAQPAPPAPAAVPAPEVEVTREEAAVVIEEQQPQSLPHTGSFNPLIGMLGLGALALAGLLTVALKRT
jgi:LPXTG-motif cell wall-anchored protein